MKNNRKNESYSTNTWDTGSSWATADTTAIAATNEPLARASIPADNLPTPPGYVKYRAIYEFSARNGDEISFQPGDIVMVGFETIRRTSFEISWLIAH